MAPYSLAFCFFLSGIPWPTQELKISSALGKAEFFPLITVYFATVINKFDWNHQNSFLFLQKKRMPCKERPLNETFKWLI